MDYVTTSTADIDVNYAAEHTEAVETVETPDYEPINLCLYQSKLCPQMAFDSQEDAKNFDDILTKCAETEQGRKEFDAACQGYPSIGAIQYAIRTQAFQHQMQGELLDKLICASECMIEGFNGLADDDCYSCPANYLLNKFYRTV